MDPYLAAQVPAYGLLPNGAKPLTMFQAAHWEKHLFRRLGWELLRQAEGDESNIQEYLRSIQSAMLSIQTLRDLVQEQDRKRALGIRLAQLKVLEQGANQLFSHLQATNVSVGGAPAIASASAASAPGAEELGMAAPAPFAGGSFLPPQALTPGPLAGTPFELMFEQQAAPSAAGYYY